MSHFITNLPQELVNYVKEFVLSVDIRLEMLYQKYKVDDKFIKKILASFTSKQLEDINWKYLYYKIYKTSPPRCSNDNLAPIFDSIPEEYYIDIQRPMLKVVQNNVVKYGIHAYVHRSDYYMNVRTEMGRKRQQNKNIIGAWCGIKRGRFSSKIQKFDWYMCNVEFELIRALILLHPYAVTAKQISKKQK